MQIRNMFKKLGIYIFLLLVTAFVLFPLIIALSQSFMTNQEVNRWPPRIITLNPTIENYITVLTQQDIRLDLWLRNSLFAASAYTLAVLLVCSPAAYAFARLRFPGNKLIFGFLVAIIMIPGQVTLIPNYLLMRDLRWIDTFYALIVPGAANVFGVFLLRQFFMQIPRELEEAAVVDGAGYFGRFRHAILPHATNAFTTLAIFVFLGHYNDLFWPTIVTSKLETRTLPVGLSILQTSYAGQYRPMILAGAVISMIPILIVYIIFQRRIIKSVVTTGLAGR